MDPGGDIPSTITATSGIRSSHETGRLDHDWSYLYFLIPAIISFFFSTFIIIIALKYRCSHIYKKRFDQLTILLALFSIIQSISWFRARYERDTTLCLVQEYLFQFSTLFQSYISLIICITIYFTIKYTKTPTWSSMKMMIWLIIPSLSFLLSCSLGSGELFCPFNYHHNLYYPNLYHSNRSHIQHFLSYLICYLLPMCLSWIFSLYYSYLTTKHASLHYNMNKITFIASQLRLYPIFLALCMFPISTFFFLVILLNHEYHILLFIGAILVNSTGTINSIVYLTIVRQGVIKRGNTSRSRSHNPHRALYSINYQVIISKLIKSSGQSYNYEENTTDLLHDDGEEDDDNEFDDEGSDDDDDDDKIFENEDDWSEGEGDKGEDDMEENGCDERFSKTGKI